MITMIRKFDCPNCGKDTKMEMSLREIHCKCGYHNTVWWIPADDKETKIKALMEAEVLEELLKNIKEANNICNISPNATKNS